MCDKGPLIGDRLLLDVADRDAAYLLFGLDTAHRHFGVQLPLDQVRDAVAYVVPFQASVIMFVEVILNDLSHQGIMPNVMRELVSNHTPSLCRALVLAAE